MAAAARPIADFHTLSNTSIQAAKLPAEFVKKLPRYPVLPATLLGRLAVDAGRRGGALGTVLLLDALRRSPRSGTASLAVMVDAKDDAAISFYEGHEFLRLPDQANRRSSGPEAVRSHGQNHTGFKRCKPRQSALGYAAELLGN